MSWCEVCEVEIIDGARWCDPCADDREPGPEPDYNEPAGDYLAKLDRELDEEFPTEADRYYRAIGRILKIRRGR